jgi:hypothetical protein
MKDIIQTQNKTKTNSLCFKCINKDCELREFYIKKPEIKVLYCPYFLREEKYEKNDKEDS